MAAMEGNIAASAPAPTVVLQVDDLCKVFAHKDMDDVTAVDHVSFQIRTG